MNHSAGEPFCVRMEVRDYECDMQGIVNNAVYLNYLEHARHQYLKAAGLDFAVLTEQGVMLVVIRTEIDYRCPLRSGDRFIVATWVEMVSRLKFCFRQVITEEAGGRLCTEAVITATAMNREGRPNLPSYIINRLTSGISPVSPER